MAEITDYPMHRAPRCTARSKRTGLPCKNAAVRGWKVCRMHGARGGSKAGPGANAWKHGMRSAAAQKEWREVRELIAEARALVASLK